MTCRLCRGLRCFFCAFSLFSLSVPLNLRVILGLSQETSDFS